MDRPSFCYLSFQTDENSNKKVWNVVMCSSLHMNKGVLDLHYLAFLNIINWGVKLVTEHFVRPHLDVTYLTVTSDVTYLTVTSFCAPTSGCNLFDCNFRCNLFDCNFRCNLFDCNFTCKNCEHNRLKMVGPIVTWQLSHKTLNRTPVQKQQNLIQNFLILAGKSYANFSS